MVPSRWLSSLFAASRLDRTQLGYRRSTARSQFCEIYLIRTSYGCTKWSKRTGT
ncbi:uncharacterized protein BDW70DRAFT_126364 [Aspergillus foveolatus]|uniref:uncharacterized protein n=1 Tax=Aspergillus foveolatus TaxID=210207 RepID=UPI003CCD2DC8